MDWKTLVYSFAAGATLNFGSQAAAQANVEVMEPVGAWELRFDDNRCAYRIQFGDSEAPTYMELRRLDPWSGAFQMALSSDRFSPASGPAALVWMPEGQVSRDPFIQSQIDDDGREWRVLVNGLWHDNSEGYTREYFDNDGPATFKRNIEYLQVAGVFDTELVFATGPMLEVFNGLDSCMSEVLGRHGIDPADGDRSDSRVEFRNPDSVLRRILRNRPDVIVDEGPTQTISFLLFLDGEGQPSSCRLVSLPFDSTFEESGCEELLSRASFRFRRGEEHQPTFYKITMQNSL